MWKDDILFMLSVMVVSAYKNNNYLQKQAINQHTFFIYKKKVVILCPILRLVCEASSMLDENKQINNN